MSLQLPRETSTEATSSANRAEEENGPMVDNRHRASPSHAQQTAVSGPGQEQEQEQEEGQEEGKAQEQGQGQGQGPGSGQGLAHGQAQRTVESFKKTLVKDPLAAYKARKDLEHRKVLDKYKIVGYIAAGTYGRVYKAVSTGSGVSFYAIKKFKADKEGEVAQYTGVSQSACREMALCRELDNHNITRLVETILEDRSIYMVFEYAEHDLFQMVHYHSHPERKPIPEKMVMSIIWQVLNGVSYLHQNWVVHRDLKPANIMVTADGVVKIGDLGLARLFCEPLQTLYNIDKVVVTIWYRAPELLLGARHYTPAVDLWAVGCIFAELLALRPIFKGEEVKMENKKAVPFQRHQFQRIVEILGTPALEHWPTLTQYPEHAELASLKPYKSNLESWYHAVGGKGVSALALLSELLEYDPLQRVSAHNALSHALFRENSADVKQNVFQGHTIEYAPRRIFNEDNDIKATLYLRPKRSAPDVSVSVRKRQR